MRILYVLYFTSITYLLAATITESQGRWTSLYDSILTLVCYVRSATSAKLLRYSFAIVTNLLSVENSLSSVRGVDVCRVSAFGTDSTCHPLDVSITPTPTLVFNTPTTRTVSAIAASPIAYNPIPYKDMYSTQLEIKTGLRKSKERRSKNGGIPSNVETTSFLDSLSTAASTIIIVQLLMVRYARSFRFTALLILPLRSQALSQPVVRYLESSVPTSPIPNDIQFGPRAAFPGCHHALILSWISTTSSLILVNPVSCIPDDQSILVDLPLWLLYFTMVLVQSYPEFTVNYPPSLTKTRSARQHPLMIEAPTSCEVVEVLSFHWFQPHSRLVLSSGMGEGPLVKLPELEGKGKFNLLPPTLEIKPAVRSQAPDVVHPLMLTTTNSLHLVDYISESWSEVTDADSSLGFNPETSSIKADSSHPDLLEVFKPTLIRPFERISGRRSTPPIQFECDKASSAGETRLPLSSTMFSAEYPLDEYDFDLLSEFPAPPRKCWSCTGVARCGQLIPPTAPVRPFSFLRKVGIGGPFSRPSISPILDRTREFSRHRTTVDTDFPVYSRSKRTTGAPGADS